MQFSRFETGNASLASVFGLMAVLGIYVLSDHKKTDNMRMEVLGRSLDSIGKQTNESALARTKSLLQVNSSGIAAVKVTNGSFQVLGGSNFQVLDGKLLLMTPDPRSNSWTSVSNTANHTMLNSEVAVEKVELNAVGTPTALIAVA
ncbi:MAG TPA: hypothetical protein VE954_35755, partial [Oligoflexus sp.]|uniref:hypothetical protein n=1 Tax=Oligoflexus sp. TaxID=1971216 RepID=UPI002D506EB0